MQWTEPAGKLLLDLVVAGVTSRTALLTWTAPNAAAVEYKIYRSRQLIDTLMASAYLDQNLTPATNYNYQIVALDASSQFITERIRDDGTASVAYRDATGGGGWNAGEPVWSDDGDNG